MTMSSHSKIRFLRIFLYTIIFVVFVSLFNSFGNIEVRGEEYFSAPSEQSMLYILGISFFGLFLVSFFLRRIHAKHLREVVQKLQETAGSVVEKKKSSKGKPSKKEQAKKESSKKAPSKKRASMPVKKK